MKCAWCGQECDDSFIAERVFNLKYYDKVVGPGSVVSFAQSTIPILNEKLIFCDSMCRWAYCQGP